MWVGEGGWSAGFMNWRRGSFRAWLVASALWVLGCSLLMWPSIESAYYLDLLSDKELLVLVCLEKLGLQTSTLEDIRRARDLIREHAGDAEVLECEKKLPEETKARLLKDDSFA